MGVRVNAIMHVFIALTIMALAAFRLGNSEIERSKHFFVEKKVKTNRLTHVDMNNIACN